jgi:hypothetical protein
LLRMAGYANKRAARAGLFDALRTAFGGEAPYGDSPSDQMQIRRGFDYYDAFTSGLCH